MTEYGSEGGREGNQQGQVNEQAAAAGSLPLRTPGRLHPRLSQVLAEETIMSVGMGRAAGIKVRH